MQQPSNQQQAVVSQIRDARDLLTRLYREIGISAVAAALEVRGEARPEGRPTVDKLWDIPQEQTRDRAA